MGEREEERTARVYVGGLTESIKKEDLEEEFEKYGKLNSVWVAFNPPGFAFIEFLNTQDAETACDNLNGTNFLGSKLRVEMARGRSRRGGGGGFRGGRGRGGGGFRGSDRGFGGRGGGGDRFGAAYGRSGTDGRFGGRDFVRRSDGAGGGGGSGSYGAGRERGGAGGGFGGRRFDGNARFRSRSPTGGPPRR